MTDEELIAIRDAHLPAQGEPFDCIAFARAVLDAQPRSRALLLKDHEIAQLVNALTTIGRDYGQAQQLRARIAQLLVPLLTGQGFPQLCVELYAHGGDPLQDKSAALMQRLDRKQEDRDG